MDDYLAVCKKCHKEYYLDENDQCVLYTPNYNYLYKRIGFITAAVILVVVGIYLFITIQRKLNVNAILADYIWLY